MKITYEKVQNRMFGAALSKLATFGGFTNYRELANVKTILKGFEKIAEKAQEEWIYLLKQYAELEADGTIKVKPGTKGDYMVIPGKEEALKKASAEFQKIEGEITAHPMPFEVVANVGLSAVDLMALEGLIAEPKDFPDLKAV